MNDLEETLNWENKRRFIHNMPDKSIDDMLHLMEDQPSHQMAIDNTMILDLLRKEVVKRIDNIIIK